ncbi:hypothetical protein [Sinosporangium siamense]|uniref:Uncharacterized protein n=1 Tax=Sinosporangium siamense TaxID=1367973 RepID=A0A919RBN7_9ACTN|nr:hypothetical protein [Sinosporangium siamense]GII89810.1 hypothetical protein Ssi02_00410 [Sinosporangium siamense]
MWEADPQAEFVKRWGKHPADFDDPPITTKSPSCPDIWELDNGDVAVIGWDLTEAYMSRLPDGVAISPGERLVVIPHQVIVAAKKDIPDA